VRPTSPEQEAVIVGEAPRPKFVPPLSLPRRMKLAALAVRFGVTGMLLRARAHRLWPWPTLTVLGYHRINRLEAVGDLDRDLIDATPEEFEEQMRFVRAHFSPVTVEAVLEALAGGDPLPANPVVVTFDDGYLDNYEQALPVLVRTGMKGVFFVSTDFLQRDRIFWWDRIGMIIRRARVDRITLSYPTELVLELGTVMARNAAIDRANGVVKTAFALDLSRFLDELARAAGVDWSGEEERGLARQSLMGWKEAQALHAAGMEVQSHTRSHRVITTLPDADLADELLGARVALEERLRVPVRSIAYPVGRSIGGRAHVRRAVADAGYKLGFTACSGENRLATMDPFDLRRVTVDRGLPEDVMRGLSVLPWLATDPKPLPD
jgi:peptidoglycan/xylan/chitin deacetylase (PgdA/CDA1 family)